MSRNWILPLTGVLLLLPPRHGSAQTGAAAAAPAHAPTLDTDSHLVGWWKLDETSGRSAADSSPPGRAGTLEGALSFDSHSSPGRIGAALRLDGNNDCVRIAGFKGVTGPAPRTVAVWIKTTAPAGEIVSWGENGPGKMWTLGFVRQHVGVTPKGGYLYMKDAIQDDTWHHVAVVVEPASPPNLHDHVTLFKDGEVALIDDIGLLDLWPIETGDVLDVRIGRQFKGLIDELRIYDRALSANEVKALFKLENSRPQPKP